ncbi:unnamed protein product [Paramecium sonneborni]|uniref:Uncharacterized protein n=1 Tax=Paramecium sonneborni TaxID=65129 RepID=A0A8S1L8M9_9CILI|nr:unnamed protein product [Paramecium sonneborni]
MQEEQKLYSIIFPDSNLQSINQVPFFIRDYEINRKQIYSSAFSNELLILGHYSCISIIDVVTRNYIVQYMNLNNQGCIVTAAAIGYYNNYILIGTQKGRLEMLQLCNSIKQFDILKQIEIIKFSTCQIQNIFLTNGDLAIIIDLKSIKCLYTNQLTQMVQKQKKEESNKYQLLQQDIETITEQFEVGISASAYCHETNQLVISLGDSSLIVYTFIGEDINSNLRNSKTYVIEPFEIINKLTISNDGRLLAIAQCRMINGLEYKISIVDLNRKGKVIKKYQYYDGAEVFDMKFFPIQNKLYVVINTGQLFVIDIDQNNDERLNISNLGDVSKSIYPLSQYQEFPNLLQISENGLIQIISFDTQKIDHLIQMPFLYFIELKLQEMFNYKPLLQQFFQSSFYIGFSGIDKKTQSNQQIMLNGEQYFEPLYDGILKMSEFREFYKTEFQERLKHRRKKYELRIQILAWSLNSIKQNSIPQSFGMGIPQQLDLKKNESEKQDYRKHSKQKKKKQFMKIEQFFDTTQDSDNKMFLYLSDLADAYLRQYNDMKLSDDRYLMISKLLQNIPYQNLTMMLLGNCSLLFDVKLPFKDYMIDLINKVDRLSYLDLSNNNITFEDIKKITRLNQLKYLDLSSNHLGNQSKKPMMKQKMRYQNLEMVNDEEQQLISEEDFSFYKLLFQKIPIINLRNNQFTDEEGCKLLKTLENNEDLRVLDISGNQLFKEQTKSQLEILIKNKNLIMKNTQTLIIEFSEELSETAMKFFTKQIIEKFTIQQSEEQKQARFSDIEMPENLVNEELPMNFYLYIVNSNQNYYWDQSLLQLYERYDEGEVDEIKTCFCSFIMIYIKMCFDVFDVIQKNFIECLKQCFCSVFFIKKYILCCYCVFLQSNYGSFITHLLGIKTADYEYNNKKDDLKKHLENSKYPLNIIFWINFLAFYFICVFVPIYFVLACQGHQWTGHFIYCGYAFAVCILELRLAKTCIDHQITHSEFSSGPYWKRIMFFSKDLLLSQMAKFDVYSDICFITTVMTCGDNPAIGYCAIIIMFLTLSTTMFHILSLLLSRQDGDENYIDYLCNYCSFVEIHLVGSLLEKWTIQNTTNFLWMKGIPNRVYAATFRTFAEDFPQFLLQVIYLFLNPNKKSIEILMLSLASSTISIIISITKSLTITKANRINDIIMMNEVKTKLGLHKEVTDPKLNEELIQFLHDYYQNFDGEEHVQILQYGMVDNKYLRKPLENTTNIRTVKGQKQTIKIMKGISMLVEQQQQQQQQSQKAQPIIKNPTQALDYEKLDFFEPYLFLMNSNQAKLIQKLYQRGQEMIPEIAQVLLELEIQDYVDNVPSFQNEYEKFDFFEGSFIESFEVQIKILETIYRYVKIDINKELSILDIGCGTGFTGTAILKLLEKLKPKGTFKILCVDHIPQIIERAKNVIEMGFEDFLQNKIIQFENYDCRNSLMQFGQFDIVNYGFAVYQAENILVKQDGMAIIPKIVLTPQEHEFYALYRYNDKEDELINLNLEAQSGQLVAKELQYPDLYQYFEIKRGEQCSICGQQIMKQSQFYSPWLCKHYCIECGQKDDDKTELSEFTILSNLVFIPSCSSDEEMNRLSSYKFGHNLFPKKNQQLNKYHPIDCHPCQREKGEERDFDPLPRYICLNCRPGKFDGQHVDICYECAKCFIDDEMENERDLKLYYLSGHQSSHLLLKIHFYYDYNNY